MYNLNWVGKVQSFFISEKQGKRTSTPEMVQAAFPRHRLNPKLYWYGRDGKELKLYLTTLCVEAETDVSPMNGRSNKITM